MIIIGMRIEPRNNFTNSTKIIFNFYVNLINIVYKYDKI